MKRNNIDLLPFKWYDEILVAGITIGILIVLGVIIYRVGGWLQ